jgi:small-conductance mechanosensitive channel
MVLGYLSVTFALANMVGKIVQVYASHLETALPVTSLTRHVSRIIIFALGILIILHKLEINIAPILATLGVGGLAVALALQDTLSNLFSGLNILMTRKIRPGDYVRLDTGQEGNVTDITWRNTTIRALENNLVIVPNSKLGAAIVINTHLPEKEMGLYLPVTVAFDNDLGLVERVTNEVAREVLADPERSVPGFEPVIRYSGFTDLGVTFWVILRVREFREQYPVKHAFFKRLHERYRAEGIKFAVPVRSVTLDKPEP